MPRLRNFLALVLATLGALVAPWAAADSWNEEFFGDLSPDNITPTPLTIYHPNNFVTGTTGPGDIDLIALTVPAFHRFESVTLLTYSGASQSFAAIQPGTVWTAGTGGSVDPTKLMGWTHFGPAAAGAGVGDNILDDMSVAKMGSSGFTLPLLPNRYTFLIQDISSAVNYVLRFSLTYNSRPYGDFNDDLKVNHQDLTKWRGEFGMNAGSDATADGDSDGEDFLIWQRNVGTSGVATPVGVSAPEPSSFAITTSLVAGMAALRRRRRTDIAFQPRPPAGG